MPSFAQVYHDRLAGELTCIDRLIIKGPPCSRGLP